MAEFFEMPKSFADFFMDSCCFDAKGG
jgi:hypothetical protein